MNRGSPEHRQSVARGPSRFNEAPIHESGKYEAGYKDIRIEAALQ